MPDPANWRPLTPDEIRTLPEARLGGSLLAIVLLACIPAVFLAAILVFFAVHADGWVTAMVFRGTTVNRALIFSIPLAWLMLWSSAFVLMSIARAPGTPTFASASVFVLAILQPTTALFGQYLFLPPGALADPMAAVSMVWPYLSSGAAGFMMAIAFRGYMREGARPNAYFLRRMRG